MAAKQKNAAAASKFLVEMLAKVSVINHFKYLA
jgi:hypothetical protein